LNTGVVGGISLDDTVCLPVVKRVSQLRPLRAKSEVRADGLHVAALTQHLADAIEAALRNILAGSLPLAFGRAVSRERIPQDGVDLGLRVVNFVAGNTSEASRKTQPPPSTGVSFNVIGSNGPAFRCFEDSTCTTSSTGVMAIMKSAAPRIALWPRSRLPCAFVWCAIRTVQPNLSRHCCACTIAIVVSSLLFSAAPAIAAA
jgi:hypothetical protein